MPRTRLHASNAARQAAYRKRKRRPHVARSVGDANWNTPPRFIEAARLVLGNIDLDPASSADAQKTVRAARYLTPDDDALAPGMRWRLDGESSRRVWLNPPYNRGIIGGFAARLLSELNAGNVAAALWLSNNATETVTWAQPLMKQADVICFPAGRIRFGGRADNSPLQGQMVIGLGVDRDRFTAAFAPLGLVFAPLGPSPREARPSYHPAHDQRQNRTGVPAPPGQCRRGEP